MNPLAIIGCYSDFTFVKNSRLAPAILARDLGLPDCSIIASMTEETQAAQGAEGGDGLGFYNRRLHNYPLVKVLFVIHDTRMLINDRISIQT